MPTWRLSKRKPTRCTRRYPPSLRRMRLPVELPHTDIHHEPESTTCRCGLKRIGEDVSGKLDYLPGVFTVERHIRGKWVCERCQTLTQAPSARQGYPDGGTAGAGAGGQVRRPPADIPPGRHLYALRPGVDALDAGRVSRRVRAAVAPAGCRSAGQIRATCRRDASADAQAGRGPASMNNHASHCCSSDRQPLACSIFDYDDWPVDVAADGDIRLFQVYPACHRKPLHLARALAALAVAGADR